MREAAPGHARLALREGTLTLDVRACRLADVLQLIGKRTGIVITASEDLPQRRISTLLETQPMDVAMRQLLSGTDAFFLYSADGRTQRLAALWVYPAGGARDIAPVPSELWASTREFEAALADQDPEMRGRAIEELIARTGEAAIARVLDALADPNAQVRQRALDAALDAGLDLPLEQLEHLTTSDASAEVRLRALQALEQQPGTTAAIEAATFDQDPDVRGEAQNILARVKHATR